MLSKPSLSTKVALWVGFKIVWSMKYSLHEERTLRIISKSCLLAICRTASTEDMLLKYRSPWAVPWLPLYGTICSFSVDQLNWPHERQIMWWIEPVTSSKSNLNMATFTHLRCCNNASWSFVSTRWKYVFFAFLPLFVLFFCLDSQVMLSVFWPPFSLHILYCALSTFPYLIAVIPKLSVIRFQFPKQYLCNSWTFFWSNGITLKHRDQ